MNTPNLWIAKLKHVDGVAEATYEAMVKSSRPLPMAGADQLKSHQKIYFNNLLTRPLYTSQHVVIAEKNEKVLGYIFCRQEDEETYVIEELFTGVNDCHAGTTLVDHAIMFAENKHATKIKLKAYPESVSFYKRFGFEETQHYINDNTHEMILEIKDARRLKLKF